MSQCLVVSSYDEGPNDLCIVQALLYLRTNHSYLEAGATCLDSFVYITRGQFWYLLFRVDLHAVYISSATFAYPSLTFLGKSYSKLITD